MLDTSTLFDVLRADARRRLLVQLCETESVRVPEELRTAGEAPPLQGPGVRRVGGPTGNAAPSVASTVLFRHTHLPKLETHGFVELDWCAQTVSRGPRFVEIEPVLRLFAENADAFPSDLL